MSLWWVVVGAVMVGGALWGPIASQVEQAPYAVAETRGPVEIRDYPPIIVAETDVAGEREAAINQGFRLIADYIFGNNTPVRGAATSGSDAPGASEKIAMTAPVIQQDVGGVWAVRFVMPERHTIESLPTPNNDAVRLKRLPTTRFAVIRFSGTADTESLRDRTKELLAFASERRLDVLSSPAYAFYNPPWTLPFLRRNEIMVEIAKK